MGKKKKYKKLSLQQFQEMTLTDTSTNKMYTNHTLRNQNLNQSDLPTEPTYKSDNDNDNVNVNVKPKHEESSNWRKNDSKTFTDINNNITGKAETSNNWRNDDNKQNTTIYRRPQKNYNESEPIHHNWRNTDSKTFTDKAETSNDWRNADNKPNNTTIYRRPQKNYDKSVQMKKFE